MNVVGDTAAAVDFLCRWHGKVSRSVITIDPISGVTVRRDFEPGIASEERMRAFIEAAQGVLNIYTLVNPAKGGTSPTKDQVIAARSLHVDADLKDLGGDPDAALARLRAMEPRPSIIFYSGGGYWPLWPLAKPYNGSADWREKVERANEVLHRAVGADPTCRNVNRLMRLPGTINVLNAAKRKAGREPALAYVVEADWERVFAFEEFAELTAEASREEPPRPRDDSRSGLAFYAALEFAKRRSGDYEEVRDELLTALRTDPKIAEWISEKGLAKGERELRRIWAKAAAKTAKGGWLISLRAPYDTAELMLQVKFATKDGLTTLHRHRGGYYRYDGSAYPEVDDAEIRAFAYAFLNQCRVRVLDKETKAFVEIPVKPDTKLVNDLLDALRSAAILPAEFAAPAWLAEAADLEPRDIISCANGLLHLPTRDLMPHTAAFFTHNALDYPFVADARAPAAWLAFLAQLWPDDEPSIETLQEIFGYMLVADTTQQKMFMLVGARRSGKGTIGRVLARMVGGPPNIAAPTLAGLGTNFGLQPLIGKRVGIISDARLGGRSDIAVITERLLSISGEDNITIDRKHRDAWTGSLGVRFLLLTNQLPRLDDASGALASRFVILLTRQSFLGREDPGLTDKLLVELPGILNWSIEGWERLRTRGHFLQPESGVQAIAQMEALGSPIKAFADDCLTLGPKLEVSSPNLYWKWKQWCEQNGRERAGTTQIFGRNLHAAFPQLKMEQRHTPIPTNPENKVRWYLGIGLKEAVPIIVFPDPY
jgi:putative DNA primase/helicase